MSKSPYHGSVVLIRNMNSSRNETLGSDSIEAQGRSHMSSTKTRDFFDVALGNSRSNSCRMTKFVLRLLEKQDNTISKVKLNKIGFRVLVLKTSSARRK